MATFTQNKIYNNTGADIVIVTSNPAREMTVTTGTLSGRIPGDCHVIDRGEDSFFNPCQPSLISWATYQAVHAGNTITLNVLPLAISNGDEKDYLFPDGEGVTKGDRLEVGLKRAVRTVFFRISLRHRKRAVYLFQVEPPFPGGVRFPITHHVVRPNSEPPGKGHVP